MTINTLDHQALCLQCLACCKILAIPIDRFLVSDIEFYEARGCRFVMLEGKFHIVIPYPCPHLIPQGCDSYDERPQACKDYDGRKDILVKDECLWREENWER